MITRTFRTFLSEPLFHKLVDHFQIPELTINVVYSMICIGKHGNRSLPVFYLSMAFHIYKDILLALIIVVIGKHKFEPSLVPDVVPMYTSMYKTRISQIEKIGPINVFFQYISRILRFTVHISSFSSCSVIAISSSKYDAGRR